jgi:uncharacterized protein (DUF488 family)
MSVKYGVVYALGYTVPGTGLLLESWMREPNTLLVDIRLSPSSRWFPDWRGSALAGRYGSRYQHLPAFGNVKYRTPGTVQLVDAEAGIEWAMAHLRQGRSLVLLCACKDYDRCHRKVVYDLLQRQLALFE